MTNTVEEVAKRKPISFDDFVHDFAEALTARRLLASGVNLSRAYREFTGYRSQFLNLVSGPWRNRRTIFLTSRRLSEPCLFQLNVAHECEGRN